MKGVGNSAGSVEDGGSGQCGGDRAAERSVGGLGPWVLWARKGFVSPQLDTSLPHQPATLHSGTPPKKGDPFALLGGPTVPISDTPS